MSLKDENESNIFVRNMGLWTLQLKGFYNYIPSVNEVSEHYFICYHLQMVNVLTDYPTTWRTYI